MVELTAEEENRVLRNRLPAGQLPTYFSSGQRQNVAISRDFESFLILQDRGTLIRARQWLSQAKDLNDDNDDRDSLIEEALTFEQTDAVARRGELDGLLGDFNQFREDFQAGQFTDVTEIGLILDDLQFVIGEVGTLFDRVYHLQTITSILLKRHANDRLDPDRLEQLESWSRPLDAYSVGLSF